MALESSGQVGIRAELRRAKTAVLAPMFVVLITVLVGGAFLSVFTVEDTSNDIAYLAARSVDERIELATVVLAASMTGTKSVDEAQRSLAVALRNDDGLTGASIFRLDGTQVARIDRFGVVAGLDPGLPDVAVAAIAADGRAFGPIRFDPSLRFEVVDAAVVVDAVVVVGVLRLDNITEVFRGLAESSDAEIYAVRDRAVVFHPEVSRRTSSASVDVDRRVARGLSGGVVIRGKSVADTIDAVVVADRPATAAAIPVAIVVVVLLGVSAVTVGLSFRRWRRLEASVVQPIDRMIAMTDRIRSGERGKLGSVTSRSEPATHVVEMEALGAAIIAMGDEIRHRIHSIELANVKLEASNRDLEEFAYAASHDLQAPLRSIGGFLDLYDEELRSGGVVASERAGYLRDRVDTAVRSMYALIDGLLAYSRITTAHGPLDEEVDLVSIVAEVTSALEYDIGVSVARLDVGPLPVVTGDPVQLHQLFQNLVQNAVKFGEPSRPLEISVTARRTPDAWEISVTDNGSGIATDFHERVFLMFRRLHPAAHSDGQGMGLALCRRIVERHGGSIWVTSEPGCGSTFSFTLPEPADPTAPSTSEEDVDVPDQRKRVEMTT